MIVAKVILTGGGCLSFQGISQFHGTFFLFLIEDKTNFRILIPRYLTISLLVFFRYVGLL